MTAKSSSPSVPGPTAAPSGARLGARERILETARTLFYRRGVNNVGIDDLAAAISLPGLLQGPGASFA